MARRTHLSSQFAWGGAFILLVLSPVIGSFAGAATVILTLMLAGPAFLEDGSRILGQHPALLVFPIAFTALMVVFAIDARHPHDVLFAANFFSLLLVPVVYLLAYRRAGPSTVLGVTVLCTLGTFAGALTASYDVFIQHKERAIGWGAGPNLMARVVVPLAFLALSRTLVGHSPWRWLFLCAPIFGIYTLYLTGTRGVFIALPVLVALYLGTFLYQNKAPAVVYAAAFALMAMTLVPLAYLSHRFLGVGDILHALLMGDSVQDQATTERLYKYSAGMQTFMKSPWIGFGWANISEASRPYIIDTSYHNDTLNLGVAAGLVGILSWLACLAAPLWALKQLPSDTFNAARFYGLSVLVSSLFIFGLTDLTFGYDLPTTLYAFSTAIILGGFRDPALTRQRGQRLSK